MSKSKFQCRECGCSEYSDIEGFGEDENGEFTDYICAECGLITRVPDED
jgi:hypothetical protein